MGITVRNNSFGSFIFKQTKIGSSGFTRTNGSGATNYVNQTHEEHICGRSGYTNNPPQLVLGIPRYRLPAGYTRFGWDIKATQGNVSWVGGDGTRYFERFWPTGAMNDYCPWTYGGRSINWNNWQIANVRNRGRVDMLNKLSDMKTNLAESLATAKQSYNLVVSSGTRLVKTLLAVKRGNLSLAAYHLGLKSSKGTAEQIIEIQYGWRPLMADVFGAKEMLESALARPPILTAKKTTMMSTAEPPTNGGWKGETQHSFRYTVGVAAKLADNYLHAVQATGLDNPALLAWELIPWSFAVDWICPIGPMLQALHADSGLQFVSGWETGVLESRVKSERVLPAGKTGNPPSIEGNGFVMQRNKLTAFPTFSPYVKSPFSTEHGLNLLALLTMLRK
jgi:hypothetical protein